MNSIEFISGKGTVFGELYCTVWPTFDWVLSTEKSNHQWKDLEQWCISTFGPTASNGVWIPNMRWYMNNSKFWFRYESDYSMFMLRWL